MKREALAMIRDSTEDEFKAGKVCQECDHWLRNPHSYVEGVCILGGTSIPPRWSGEMQTCDGYSRLA